MVEEVELLRKAAVLLTEALRTADGDKAKRLLRAHQDISQVRAQLEREQSVAQLNGVLGIR